MFHEKKALPEVVSPLQLCSQEGPLSFPQEVAHGEQVPPRYTPRAWAQVTRLHTGLGLIIYSQFSQDREEQGEDENTSDQTIIE